MRSRIRAAFLVLALGGCAGAAPGSGAGGAAVSAVGTPFLLAFKIPACVMTVAIAGPIAGLSTLAAPSPNIAEADPRQELGDDVAHNCGPPYIVAP